RNYSLQNASGDWILYLDADERLNNNSVQELKRITAESCKKAYWCNVISLDEINKHPSVMSYARLFPNNKKVKFTGTIHEQIEPSLIENGFSIEKSSIEIIHLGYSVSEEEIKKKAERNLELLLNEFQASGSGYYAFQLGQTLGILKRNEEAAAYFEAALNDNSLKREYKAVAYRYLAISYAERKEFLKSLELIEKSIAEDDEQPLSLMAAAKIFLRFKMYDKAADAALRSYEANKKYLNKKQLSAQNILMDEKELSYHGLEIAILVMDKKLFNFFYEKITNAGEKENTEAGVFNNLYNNIKIDETKISPFIDEMNERYLEPLLVLLEKYNHLDCRFSILKGLAVRFIKNPYIHLELGKLYLTTGNLNLAQQELERTVELKPEEPSFYFYLISVYMQNSNLKKLFSTLDTLEKRFSSYPEVKSKVDILKQKLVSHLS
ncbi:MAG: tetratricopeptide repeat protein, partial [Ignavibacteriaceae bacterium]